MHVRFFVSLARARPSTHSLLITFRSTLAALFHTIEEHEDGDDDQPELRPIVHHHIQVAQALFPSSLCTAAVSIIKLIEDPQVGGDGSAVYELAYKGKCQRFRRALMQIAKCRMAARVARAPSPLALMNHGARNYPGFWKQLCPIQTTHVSPRPLHVHCLSPHARRPPHAQPCVRVICIRA